MVRALYALLIAGMLFATAAANTVTITNGTGNYDIYYVYISPSSSSSWGDDWLGSDVMNPGDSWEFNVGNGTYDFKLVDEDGDSYILYNVPVHGDYTWYVTLDDLGEYDYNSSGGHASTGGGNCAVTIYNDLGSWDIYYIYISPSSSSDWGDDWLGSSEILSPGESKTFYVSRGQYDMRCTDEDGDTYTLMNINVGNDGYYWSVDLSDLD